MIYVIGERVNDRRLTVEQVIRWQILWRERGWKAARVTPAFVRGACRARLDRVIGREYIAHNLLPPDNRTGRWDQALADRVAAEALSILQGTVVALGRRVANTLVPHVGLDFGEIHRIREDLLVLVLPHPSGRNRWWSEPGAEEKSRAWVEFCFAFPRS